MARHDETGGRTLRLLAPNKITSLAYECQEEHCGLLMIVEKDKEKMKATSTACPACAASGSSKQPTKTPFPEIFETLETFTKHGVRFVIPPEEVKR